MATSTPSFSVFPPPRVPRISVPNPRTRKPSLSTIKSIHKDSVVITIEEETVPKIPDDYLPQTSQQRGMSSEIAQGGNERTLSDIAHTNTRAPNNVAPRTPPKHHSSPEPSSIGSSSTLVRDTSSEPGSMSPIVPIRSMFPVYNPNVSLANQRYVPQRPSPAHLNPAAPPNYSQQDLRSHIANSVGSAFGSRVAPPGSTDIPLDTLNPNKARVSSPKQLQKLWDASHGAEPDDRFTFFNLELARTAEATFTLGPDPSSPFYTIMTYDTNEISITKTNPQKRSVARDIVLTSIEPAERRLPPGDGLVTFIFPKPAAMLAIDQSVAIAADYGLAPTHRDEFQQAAMRRAADQEASYLRYNHVHRRYELEHPAIARKQQDANFTVSPTSPQTPFEKVLHISVNETAGRTSHGKPSITVTYPASNRSPGIPTDNGFRLSTVGQSETDYALASLDLYSNILQIDTNRVLDLMPSLFAIDSIVSAITTVAIADRSTNIVMGNMEIWLPPPKAFGSPLASPMSGSTRSTFYATIAEREQAEAESKLLHDIHQKDVKSSSKKGFRSERNWFGKEKKQKERKKIVIGDFDVEKLTHYQGGNRDGQALPGPVRGVVTLVVTGLRLVVWLLTTLVQILVWILVTGTRCVTSEKF